MRGRPKKVKEEGLKFTTSGPIIEYDKVDEDCNVYKKGCFDKYIEQAPELIEIKETHKLLNYADFLQYSDTFIETGSCVGEGIQRALNAGFEKVLSVEAKIEFFDHCMTRFKYTNVRLFYGKSSDRLSEMIEYYDNEKCIIFLDSHPAGPNTFGHDDLMLNGERSEFHQHNIIQKELELILAHRNDHVILIDDQCGIIDESMVYIDILLKANPSYKFYFYDEHLPGGTFYKNKCLVAIPE